ncbi:NuoH homolog [Aeropyrum pernix K1]|uniref:NuoH homolog n=1 Tax=Aeropyrum pernix (strain ATCC 700893 / DSM 11879 / JCM 9820 / NBRC 100138 / K1) TaxID=272557 RepID=Q9YC30_AERPE|nr:NADH-quinone oxidoreductase subunit NuoH [Aeropyrum pernix]BAA80418.2 NuoH homolog [Aeropyrum pernix K1]
MSVLDVLLAIIFYPPIWQLLILGFGGALLIAIVAVWFERKAAARVQRRIGPYWASPRLGGLLHLVADMMRYMFQQVIIPRTVDYFPFLVAPIVGMAVSILPFAVVPLTANPSYWPLPPGLMEYSLLLALAISTLPPIFLIVAGWAANNPFTIVGGVREAFIILAYELIAILSLLAPAITVGSFNIVEIVQAQGFFKWFIILNPLAFLAAVIAIAMSTSAFPFEIPESEPEVVAGPFTEYSGILYALNMGGAYMRRFAFSLIASLVLLGGWYPVVPGEGVVMGYLLPSLVVVAKAALVTLAISFLRAVYGRYRLDQALDLAWRLVLPLTLLAILLALIEAYLGIVQPVKPDAAPCKYLLLIYSPRELLVLDYISGL